jgi:hypothetical protein
MGRTHAEATSPSSRGSTRTGRANGETEVTGPVQDESCCVPSLPAFGEAGYTGVDSKRRWNALRSALKPTGEKSTAGLDFGGLMEGTVPPGGAGVVSQTDHVKGSCSLSASPSARPSHQAFAHPATYLVPSDGTTFGERPRIAEASDIHGRQRRSPDPSAGAQWPLHPHVTFVLTSLPLEVTRFHPETASYEP